MRMPQGWVHAIALVAGAPYGWDMSIAPPPHTALLTLRTLAVGAIGAGLGHWLSFPVFILTGPAILVALAALSGMRFAIYPPLWNGALLVVGVTIGSGVTDQAAAAFLRWPMAFAVLALVLAAIIQSSRSLLVRGFGYSQTGAILAATPGHLSFVLSMAAELNAELPRISTVQAVRLLSLTLIVPFGARLMGVDMTTATIRSGVPLSTGHFFILLGFGLLLGLVFRRFRIPAPFLIGGMLVAVGFHLGHISQGQVSAPIALAGFLVVGTMIGTRFSGVRPSQLRRDGLAGLLCTGLAVGLAGLAAWPVSIYLGMPILHVLVAFSPGGLETMLAMGAVLGASPGFVTAAHVARLLLLLFLLPIFLGRSGALSRPQR